MALQETTSARRNGVAAATAIAEGTTPLMQAATEGDEKLVVTLLSGGGDNVDARDKWGRTALMLAATAGWPAAVKCLIDANANVSLQDYESGYSSLHRALFGCHLVAAAVLLHGGATMKAPLDPDGLSPLELLQVRFGSPPCSPALGAHEPGASTFGDVYTWGDAGGAALGRGVTGASHNAAVGRVQLPPPLFAAAVATAKHHTLLIDSDGGLHSCGLGVGGRLGHGDEKQVVLPRRVEGLLSGGVRRVVCVAAALDVSLAVDEHGGCYSWGAEPQVANAVGPV